MCCYFENILDNFFGLMICNVSYFNAILLFSDLLLVNLCSIFNSIRRVICLFMLLVQDLVEFRKWYGLVMNYLLGTILNVCNLCHVQIEVAHKMALCWMLLIQNLFPKCHLLVVHFIHH